MTFFNEKKGLVWLLVLGLKEGLVECATLCVKSEVILGLNSNIHSLFIKEL